MSDTVTIALFGLAKGLAWPLVVFIVALVYRTPISAGIPKLLQGLLNRRWRAKIPGVAELEFDAAEQQQKSSDILRAESDPSTIELREIPGLTRTLAMAKLEREIHVQLNSVTADKVDVLVRNLAQARLESHFGYIYAGIFGSQIVGLKELQARRKVPTDEAYNFWLGFREKYPDVYSEYGFSGWLNFMKNHNLVTQDDTTISISDVGVDFLLWLKAKHLSENKPW